MLRQLSLTFMSGPRDGQLLTFPLPADLPKTLLVLTIGRRDGLDVSLPYDSQVSRLHAHLVYDGEQFWLEDTGSRNGTFIGETRIPDGDRMQLEPGALFRIGRTWLRLDPLPTDVTAPAEPVDPDDGSIF
jgi:pSer/pThr/pTyr-binding forkhead associated (FHA) protein